MIVLTLVAASAGAEPDRKSVETRLAGYERAFQAEDLVALGPGADKVLAEIAGDREAPPVTRARAVSALGYARTPAARAFLEKTLRTHAGGTGAIERLLLRKAAVALGFQGLPGAAGLVAPLLLHADEEVRLDAAIGLGLTRSQAGLDTLRARLPGENSGAVKFQIEKQIKILEVALPSEPKPTEKDRQKRKALRSR